MDVLLFYILFGIFGVLVALSIILCIPFVVLAVAITYTVECLKAIWSFLKSITKMFKN